MLCRKQGKLTSNSPKTTSNSHVLAEHLSQTPIEKIRTALSQLNVFSDLGIAHGEKCGKYLGPKSLALLSKKTGLEINSIKEIASDVFAEIELRRKSILSGLLIEFPGIGSHELGRKLNVEPVVVGYYLRKYGLFVLKSPIPTSPIEVSDSVRIAIEEAIISIGKTKLKFAGRKPSFWTLNAISSATGISQKDLKEYSDSGALDFFAIASNY